MWQTIKAYLLYTWGGLHRYFGNQNNLLQEHRRAVHYFTRAYQTNPSMQQALLARAILLAREMDQPEAAIADFGTLLAEDPSHGPALFNRALVHQQLGNYTLALADVDAYLLLRQSDSYRQSALTMRRLLQALVEEGEG